MALGSDSFSFNVGLKVLPTEGNLVYEYNPFYNYRINETMIYYQERLWSLEDFWDEFAISTDDTDRTNFINGDYGDGDSSQFSASDWKKYFNIPSTETLPVVYQAGQLVDFDTDQLSFSLNNPVNLTAQWSYDNSVNLIINDGLNPPRLINSRFSPTERHQYQVCNRKGDNDTNIYDMGDEFDIDTSLYKKMTTIPKLTFSGVEYGGNLKVGNYFFYFKYVDDDGNESDFFAESGLVSIFIGNTADGCYTGFRDENAYKSVKFIISNTDSGYQKILIYYTRATGDIYQNATVNAYKIEQNYYLADSGSTTIIITGYEATSEVSTDEINAQYQIYGSAETQAVCQNMLFLANVDKPETEYEDLADCALRFCPYVVYENYAYDQVGLDYTGAISNTYFNANYIYKKTGYWDDEIYRFGVVFIKNDLTLTPVFNVRGMAGINTQTSFSSSSDDNSDSYNYTDINFYQQDDNGDDVTDNEGNKVRNYVTYDPQYFIILKESNSSNSSNETLDMSKLENAKGVVHIDDPDPERVIGFNFRVKWEVIDYLQNTLGIKGMFFVRQKRIPTTLGQAYIIGIDKESYTPVLPMDNSDRTYSSDIDEDLVFMSESFLSPNEDYNDEHNTGYEDRILIHDFPQHARTIESFEVRQQAAICPEYDIDKERLNSFFTGTEIVIRNCATTNYLERDGRHFYPTDFLFDKGDGYTTVKIVGIEDDVKLGAIGDDYFRGRAGEAEEAFRYEYLGEENKDTDADNLLRGSYGPFLGITGYENAGQLVDIKIPGYEAGNLESYFLVRYNDASPYYAVSDRIDFSDPTNYFVQTNVIGNSITQTEDASVSQLFVNNTDISYYYVKLSSALYRGDCYICQFTHRINRNFQDPSAPTNDTIVDPDCWEEEYEVDDGTVKTENFENINLGDVNAVMLGMWITLVVRSSYNLNIRSLDGSNTDERVLSGHQRGFYPYFPMSGAGSYKIPEALCINKGFQSSVSARENYELPDVPWIKNEYSNRIAYSNVQIQDAFQNGWRTFQGQHYRDYPKTYGSITKLIEWGGALICVCEHGILKIPVNERALAGQGEGGNVYVNTSNVLPENPAVLSDCYGSQWRDSVIKTSTGTGVSRIYGVDTISKKIWAITSQGFSIISDFFVEEFLIKNISLAEREMTPIIGIRNVKTHFNKWKNDVMFTFYDNIYSFEEKVWNLCWNELWQKWVTFYSWVPSFSENIYNQYFSFDRNTSKYIAKLGVSKTGNDFSDGVTLSDNIIYGNDDDSIDFTAELSLSNRTLPSGDNTEVYISYELVRDVWGNYKYFEIENVKNDDGYVTESYLKVKDGVSYSDLCSEFYLRYDENEDEESVTANGYTTYKPSDDGYNLDLTIYSDDSGRRQWLDQEDQKNADKVVRYLNIRANITTVYTGQNATLEEYYSTGQSNLVQVDAGYYESVVAVIPYYNMQFLTTDFWKHGQGGIIDIADKIYPTYWYGKQHPFEIEFVVNDNPGRHKIFDNLQIISNNAEPESFHYEIIGDCFMFANDKKNMYIRQEATEELYQYNGYDISYDHDYADLESEHRPIMTYDINSHKMVNSTATNGNQMYSPSTLLPLYYYRQDTINEIEDYYHNLDGIDTMDFSNRAGGEIVHYDTLDEYRIWNHCKAVDMAKYGRLRGNMQYIEDIWYVQINPINIVQCNEPEWVYYDEETATDANGNTYYVPHETTKVPVELKQSIVPDEILALGNSGALEIPADSDGNITDGWQNRGYVQWPDRACRFEECKVKDKWLKVRIRYSGEKLAVIHSIKTLYSLSYS